MEIGKKEGRRWKKVRYIPYGTNVGKALIFRFREMQLFLLAYIIIEICEIFTVGLFPLKAVVRIVWLLLHG
jgi:hypothetical protein